MQNDTSIATNTLIVGLGETGLSVARFLRRHSLPFAVADSRSHPSLYDEFKKAHPDVTVRLGDFDNDMFLAAGRIVLSPGVSLKTPAVQCALEAGIPVLGDIELFARALAADEALRAPVVAITGSNGKSTVTALVADMAAHAGLRVAAGGNFGPPALDLISAASASESPDLYVLELSSFQLETTDSLTPAASTVLNISEDHSDRYDSFADYVRAKQRIHHGSATVVLNREDPHPLDFDTGANVIGFGLDRDGDGDSDDFSVVATDDGRALARGTQPWLACGELGALPGDSGLLNAQAALALGCAVGLPRAAMIEALRLFEGLPHRLQTLGAHDDVVWINDSKATNVAAAVAALNNVERPCVWIAGGDGKGADFSPLRDALDRVREAILIGRDATAIAAAVETVVPVQFARDFDDAIARARTTADAGDCVLLSPACSSLDMFSSYAERGACFARAFQEQAA